MRYLRDLGRRKVRTALTILGMTIGIWALVVFGSMANKITALVEGGSGYYADKVTVSDSPARSAASPPRRCRIRPRTSSRPSTGVDVVVPAVMMLMDDQEPAVSMASHR